MGSCTQDSGTCSTCQAGCTRKPGWFLPDEAEQTAAALGLSLDEFFRTKLAVDWWEGDSLVEAAEAGHKAIAELDAGGEVEWMQRAITSTRELLPSD